GGQQGVRVRVGAVAGDEAGPGAAVQAGQKGAFRDLGRGRVEQGQRRRAAGLTGYGDTAGEVWETVRRQRESSWVSRVDPVDGVRVVTSRYRVSPRGVRPMPEIHSHGRVSEQLGDACHPDGP